MKNIKPIIVLGSARNGTTMLCNLITEHPQISSVQHELHWGLHESNIYENMKYWGPFETLDKYLFFLELYCSMDTFQITGLQKQDYYNKQVPNDFLDFYFEMMDEFANKQGTAYWLTKIDPLFLLDNNDMKKFINRLHERYGEVKFISVQRGIIDVIRSYLKMEGKQKKLRETVAGKTFAFILGVVRYNSHYKKINLLLQEHNGLAFEFEAVVNNQESCRKVIADYLNLEHQEGPSSQIFRQNSSFEPSENKRTHITFKLLIRVLDRIVKVVPFLPEYLLVSYEKLKPKRFPDSWRLKKEKYFYEMFQNELHHEKQYKLLDLVKERSAKNA